MLTRLRNLVFFGNLFYAVCAVSLAAESNLQLGLSLNVPLFYAVLFSGTVVYYTWAYISENYLYLHNPRTAWYSRNRQLVKWMEAGFFLVALLSALAYLWQYGTHLLQFTPWHGVIALLFPFVAACYYNLPVFGFFRLNLRQTGWMKPFVIGFVWAGAVTAYPLLCRILETGQPIPLTPLTGWFFLKNWMYITVLCMMFDIKDYASDSNKHLKTFVVQLGLRKTLFYILLPLTLAGLLSLLLFAGLHSFPALRIAVNVLPFLAMLAVAYAMHRRKGILFYLAVIDGLMLLKAFCGILGVLLGRAGV